MGGNYNGRELKIKLCDFLTLERRKKPCYKKILFSIIKKSILFIFFIWIFFWKKAINVYYNTEYIFKIIKWKKSKSPNI